MAEYMYGIRNVDKKTVSINEIPNDASGLKCECTCPQCGRPLEACSLQGKVNRYFRHHTDKIATSKHNNVVHCDVFTANETALHKMAKEIIAEELKIFVPVKKITLKEAQLSDLPRNIVEKIPCYELHPAHLVECNHAEMEKSLGSLKPDVVLKTRRGEILVEIFVRHKVDENKKEKAIEYGSAMLEIDLSQFIEAPIDRTSLRQIICDSPNLKEWIYYPLNDNSLKKAQDYYNNLDIVKQYHKDLEDEKKRKIRFEYERQLYEKKKELRINKNELLFQPENYAAELNRLRSDTEFIKACNINHKFFYYDFKNYFQKHKTVPLFIDIPITGEIVFQCDRRIWQSILFNRFIYGRTNDYARFNTQDFFEKLKNEYKIPVNYDLCYKGPNPRKKHKEMWLPRDVIETYMYYLEVFGFIEASQTDYGNKEYYWKTVLAKKTIIPPNKSAFDALKLSFQNADIYSPDIDDLITDQMSKYFEQKRQQEKLKRELAEAERKANEIKIIQKKRTEFEAAIQTAKNKAKEKKEKLQQEILSFDYSQAEKQIYDANGYRMVQCSCCGKIVKACSIANYDLPNINKGICRECHIKQIKN